MMNKIFNNYNILFTLRTLKNVLTIFLDSFLVLYFMQISNNNILQIGIYKLVAILFIYIVIFFTRNLCKTNKRILLMRIGIILNLIYFITIMLLKENIVNYVYLVGMLYGLEEGFYYSVFNPIQSDGIKNEDRSKYIGTSTALQHILSILLPFIFGSIISSTGFINCLIIAVIIIIIQIILSYYYKDFNIPSNKRADIKGYYKIMKQDNRLKLVFFERIFSGLTYCEGAFTYIITIYIIKVFSDSFSLGIFTSIFSIVSAIIGLRFVKIIKPRHYNFFIIISTVFTIISLFIMIINCNMISIVLFNLFQRFSKGIIDLVNNSNEFNIANIVELRDEYKVEYFLSQETGLVIGRIISNSLFILMAFTDNNIILYLFILFIILWSYSSIRLQIEVEKNRL